MRYESETHDSQCEAGTVTVNVNEDEHYEARYYRDWFLWKEVHFMLAPIRQTACVFNLS